MERRWTLEDAATTFGIDRWGGGYFSVNSDGHVAVSPNANGSQEIDVWKVVEDLKARGIPFPVMLRFQDILRHRVRALSSAFRKAIEEYSYEKDYLGVFPIKVNQLREVVEEIVDAGQGFRVGLEAGSKPELIAALCTSDNPDSLVICNGFKDRDFILSALYGQRLGRRVIIVIEKLSELQTVMDVSDEIGIPPQIGIRVKLSSRGSGKWEKSSGDQAKFGMSIWDLMEAVRILKARKRLSSLVLTHFHMGSQIPDIWKIKGATREAARIYSKLRKMHVPVEFLDVGGGLGIDYDGSRTNYHYSVNYSLQEYANDIVWNILEVCRAEDVPVPNIVSESGRALTAHHAVLVIPVIDVDTVGVRESVRKSSKVTPKDPRILHDMKQVLENVSAKNAQEAFHDAQASREEALNLFNLGLLTLQERSRVEQLFWHICQKILKKSEGRKYIPEELQNLQIAMADKYYCSFSIFQSCPDFWAIDHLFPIMPLHKLDRKPTRQSILVDITCDSDGKVDQFVDLHDIRHTLPLHAIKPDEEYYLGVFLLGAYQDAMGDLHNLFGRVNEAHVFKDAQDGYYVEKIILGDTASQVLDRVQYRESELMADLSRLLEARVEENKINWKEREEVVEHFTRALGSYTYISP